MTVKGPVRIHETGGESLGPGFGPRWMELGPNWVASGASTPTRSYLLHARERSEVRLKPQQKKISATREGDLFPVTTRSH